MTPPDDPVLALHVQQPGCAVPRSSYADPGGAVSVLRVGGGGTMPLGENEANPCAATAEVAGLVAQAGDAATFLKALGHDGRLTILCHLRSGPKSVTELENLLASRQAVVSQQLARLRLEGLVSARREGQAIYYSILDPRVDETIALLSRLFRQPG